MSTFPTVLHAPIAGTVRYARGLLTCATPVAGIGFGVLLPFHPPTTPIDAPPVSSCPLVLSSSALAFDELIEMPQSVVSRWPFPLPAISRLFSPLGSRVKRHVRA